MPNYLKHLIRIGWLPFVIFMVNYSVSNLFPLWYLNYSLDVPMHFFGGMSAAWSINYAMGLLEKNKTLTVSNLLIRWIIIVSATMALAVIWEFYEFTSDHFFGTHHQPSNADTMKDLFDGTIGAIALCLLAIRRKKV